MSSLADPSLIKHLSRIGARSHRKEIVSPSLCDDIIRRLAPSLEQYKGCTVVDIDPGACLFSSKLHQFLKPRSHVLLEVDRQKYAHFLDPLLSAPDSRYHLRDWRDERIWHPQALEDEGLIPKSTCGSNNATLHILNATDGKFKTLKDANLRIADARALNFAQNARQRTGFHARGPTRLLMWCDDYDKKPLVPRSVDSRRKTAVLLESHCRVEEVVGFGGAAKQAQREVSINIASSKRVQRRMNESRVPVIPGREQEKAEDTSDLSGVSRYWHEELRDLQDKFESGKLPQFIGYPPGAIEYPAHGGRISGKKRQTPEFKRYLSLRRNNTGQNEALKIVQDLLSEQDALDALDLRTYDPSLTPEQRTQMYEEYDTRNATLKQKVSRLNRNQQGKFFFLNDDRHAFYSNQPPLLSWDNRTYEPLTASPSEFYRPKELALLDFQAKPLDTFPITDDQAFYAEFIASAIFATRGPSNLRLLKKVAPGAYEMIMSKVEEIRDARYGGRRDVDGVRIRTLTPRMLWRMAIEWGEWPFKPELKDLLAAYRTVSQDHRVNLALR